jgi:HAMP domain-containing protein
MRFDSMEKMQEQERVNRDEVGQLQQTVAALRLELESASKRAGDGK